MRELAKDLMKGAVYAKLAKKALKTVRAQLDDIDWDKDYWLHKVGLTTYKPGKFATGGLGLFVLGAVAGGVIGLALAPKAGAELRTEMKERLDTWRTQQMGAVMGDTTQVHA